MVNVDFERRSFTGNAVETTLAAPISPTDLTFALTSATGWPDSTEGPGPFYVVIDPGGTEEKVRCDSRTGTSVTVAATSDRGLDGTSPASHAAGVVVRHCFTAIDADEANRVAAATLGQVAAKGDIPAGLAANDLGVISAPPDGYALVADSGETTGWGAQNLDGYASTTAMLAADSALDTRLDAIEGAWAAYALAFSDVGGTAAIGNGTIIARYKQVGKMARVQAHITFGTTTNFGGAIWEFTLPVAAPAAAAGTFTGRIATVGTAVADDLSPGEWYAGFVFVNSTTKFRVYGFDGGGKTYATALFGVGQPFVWAANDTLSVEFTYESA